MVCLFVYLEISKDNRARTIEPEPAVNLPERFCILLALTDSDWLKRQQSEITALCICNRVILLLFLSD